MQASKKRSKKEKDNYAEKSIGATALVPVILEEYLPGNGLGWWRRRMRKKKSSTPVR